MKLISNCLPMQVGSSYSLTTAFSYLSWQPVLFLSSHPPLKSSLLCCCCVLGWLIELGARLVGIEPAVPFTFDPDATARLLMRLGPVGALSVLPSVLPLALVLASVGPQVDTVAMLAILEVLAFIASAIFPSIDAVSMHIVIDPFTVVFAAVDPLVDTAPVDLVLIPVARVF